MEGYTIIPNNFITSNISNGAYRVYSVLLSMCYGEKDYCYPSQSYLSSMLHKSIRTIQRYIQELVKCNLIRVKRRGSISNMYFIINKKFSNKAEKLVSKVKETIKKVKSYSSKKKSLFNDFEQRKYNFDELESQLLGKSAYDPEKLIE